MQEQIKKIKQHLEQADLATALKHFSQLAGQLQSNALNKAVILLHDDYSRISRRARLGTITREQERTATNAITLSLLDYLELVASKEMSEEILAQKLLESIEDARKIVQNHFGSGDNVAGDKNVDNSITIIDSKNVVTGNITAGGDVKIGDTIHQAPHKVPKRLTYIPPIDPNNVFGRTQDITQLNKAIQAHPKQLIAINGMGGIGKTTLLQTWYQQNKYNYQYKAWISVDAGLDKAIISHTELLQNLGLRKAIVELPEKERLFTSFSLVINKLRELEGENNLLLLVSFIKV